MLSLLVTLLVVCIVLALAWYVITTLLPLPEPLGKIVQVVFVVIAVIVVCWFLLALVGQVPQPAFR
jgi:hypothetical protein